MKNLLLLSVISLSLFSCAVKPKEKEVKPVLYEMSSNFDQKLADSLGADERGMKNYMLVILKTGSNDAKITDKTERAELFKGHFSNMTAMEKAGKLKMAGPFATKNSLGIVGFFFWMQKPKMKQIHCYRMIQRLNPACLK